MKDSTVFSHLMDEYGSLEQEEREEREKAKAEGVADADSMEADPKKANPALMQAEERNTGSVTWTVYSKYLRFAGGVVWAPVIILLLTLTQGAQGMCNSIPINQQRLIFFLVGNNLFLGFWTANSISGFRQGDYMAVYAALGKP
jgi:ATP-binding cassette subfamily C (CFTR/MRP) protein 1